jgi:3-hydroxybutyrate dehydrogenase
VNLKGKTALVTGSTSGIGLGIARTLARSGANLVLNGFGDPATIEALRQSVERNYGVTATYSDADMSEPDAIKAMIEDAARQFGTVDILVNNAGIQHTAPTHDFPTERWDAVIAINLSAVFHAIHAVLPLMRAKGWGRIINIASVHGLVASVNKAAYVAAKHGVIGLTKVVALENAGSAVTCNAICPGWALTPLVQKQIDALAEREGLSQEEACDRLLSEKQPSRQFTTPEQLGDLALFLCGPAAANMQGSIITMDGGWTAQ